MRWNMNWRATVCHEIGGCRAGCAPKCIIRAQPFGYRMPETYLPLEVGLGAGPLRRCGQTRVGSCPVRPPQRPIRTRSHPSVNGNLSQYSPDRARGSWGHRNFCLALWGSIMASDIPIKAITQFEPFVDAEVAGKFLSLDPETVRRKARRGTLPGHPIGEGSRLAWRFLLSELAAWLKDRRGGKQ
jgi:hypothetical protein